MIFPSRRTAPFPCGLLSCGCCTVKFLLLIIAAAIAMPLAAFPPETPAAPPLQIARLLSPDGAAASFYPDALAGLLDASRMATGVPFAPAPLQLTALADPRLRQCPLLYINWDDRTDWEKLPPEELSALRSYIMNGGTVLIDAGIAAAFLRNSPGGGQHHSYAEWRERPEVRSFFTRLLPGHPFTTVPRNSPLFHALFDGLPDDRLLPENVRSYIRTEKWPDGTYSAMAIQLNRRTAVVAFPILAMGWGRTPDGAWSTPVRLRTLESGADLGERLRNAAVTGGEYDVEREDGGYDRIYCQEESLPAWACSPSGQWRVFRYYDSRQINDFVHIYYTRLGLNLLICTLLGH